MRSAFVRLGSGIAVAVCLGAGLGPALADVQTAAPGEVLGPDFAPSVVAIANRAARSLVQVIRTESTPGMPRLIGTGISLGDGKIMTSAGVVGRAESVLVAPAAGDTVEARVIATDRRTNLAVLDVPGLNLPALPVTSGAIVFPGATVVAVGLGAPGTPEATFGTVVVSQGLHLGYSEVEMLQTTNPIFRGYTGGALVDDKGYLVGMLSGVVALDSSEVMVPDGIGLLAGVVHRGRVSTVTPAAATLVLPALAAVRIAGELITKGYVERGYIGLEVELTQGPGTENPTRRRGVLVHQVVGGGPAERAGLLPGDLILEFGPIRVHGPEELSFLVSSRRAGTLVTVRYLRRGHQITTSVKLDQAPPLDWDPSLDTPLAGAVGEPDTGGSR